MNRNKLLLWKSKGSQMVHGTLAVHRTVRGHRIVLEQRDKPLDVFLDPHINLLHVCEVVGID